MWYIWPVVAILLIAYFSILLGQPIPPQDDSPQLPTSSMSVSLDSRPELNDMLVLKCGDKFLTIIETVAAQCNTFGIMLGLPSPVVNTEWFVSGPHTQSKCQSIVERWLEGKGKKPVKWKTVIEALQILYPILVDDLDICLHSNKHIDLIYICC